MKNGKNLANKGLKNKAQYLLNLIAENPYQNPPPYEKLVGDINIQHRLVSDNNR